MQNIESSEQFRQTAQELLQRLNDRINDLSNSGYKGDQQVNRDTNKEIEYLRTQHQNVKEALSRYGSESERNWEKVKGEARYALEEVENNWKIPQDKQEGDWRVSTGQSDRGAAWNATGLGDRAGMEDPQTGIDNSTQYTSFGNTRDIEEGEPSGRTSQPRNPDDGKTHPENTSTQTSYEQMKASNREREQGKDEEGWSKTNRGGDATQDDPGGSADKGDRKSNYILPDDEESAARRPMDSRAM